MPAVKFEKLSSVILDADGTVEDAARMIFAQSLAHLEQNLTLLHQYSDSGALLQIRVGLRRIRLALKMFKQVLPAESRKQLKQSIKLFGGPFGRARDLDVVMSDYLRAADIPKVHGPALEKLRTHIAASRAAEYDVIRTLTEQKEFQAFLGVLKRLVSASWHSAPALESENLHDLPLKAFAARILDSSSEHLEQMDGALSDLTNAGLHKFRRQIKKARYQLRFLISLCEGEAASTRLAALRDVQACLGRLWDIVQCRQLVSEFADQMKLADYAAILELEAALAARDAENFRQQTAKFAALWRNYLDLARNDAALISL